jgi:hypothetical protein
MIVEFLFQFTVECIRALLIDELSERVRGRVSYSFKTIRTRKIQRRHSKQAMARMRRLSTEKPKTAH